MKALKTFHQARAAGSRVLRIVRLALREIFDEAAYARYLQRVGVSASRASYARFLAEKHHTKAPAARCC